MIHFISQYKVEYGVEPMCAQLPIAPSTYYRHVQHKKQPYRRSKRAKNDEFFSLNIRRVWEDSFGLYGARKIWKQLHREHRPVARSTVERLMRALNIQGVSRGNTKHPSSPKADSVVIPDRVNRQFIANAPNQLWVADFTYVATWSGWVYVAFVIDVYARSVVGWRVSRRMDTGLVLDALEQALWSRQPDGTLTHHSDRGSQYLSIRYTDRLLEQGITASVGSTGDAYDNALAESINGLFKTEVIRHQGPWKGIGDVEYATLEWVDWYNCRRLMASLGYKPPFEYEMDYYYKTESALVA